jgi:hypothetical protein
MICPECKQAGKVLTMPVVVNRRGTARRLHEKCTNPHDCPCQHKLPEEIEINGES